MAFWRKRAEAVSGWAHGRLNDPVAGAAPIREALADQGQRHSVSFLNALLAELETESLGAERALARLDEALAPADQGEVRSELAFVHRLRGEILLKRDAAKPAEAEEAFQTAIAIAKSQSARSHALQASLSLAKLFQSTGRPLEAHAVLAPALEGFAPTPEMPEIAEAQALIERLAWGGFGRSGGDTA